MLGLNNYLFHTFIVRQTLLTDVMRTNEVGILFIISEQNISF